MKYGFFNKQYNEIINILVGYPEIEKAVLFGSRAIGTWKEASDVDIAIYGEQADIFVAGRLKDHFEEETFLPFFFDIIAFNSISSEELKEHIRDKGVEIYRKGNERFARLNAAFTEQLKEEERLNAMILENMGKVKVDG